MRCATRNSILFIVVCLLYTCRKDPVSVPPGTVEVRIAVHHHSVPIANARIYRKDNASIFPGRDTTLYSEKYQTDAQGRFTLAGIGNGQHAIVFYAEGIDPVWDSTQTTPVWGYQFLSMYTRPGKDTVVTVSIPVSE
jgi:hypothetical protein